MSSRAQPYSNRAEPARGSSLHTIKTQQKAKEEEEKIKTRRRKGIVTLMLQFCQEMGYARTLDALQAESGLQMGKNAVAADNIDLTTVVTEYEDYYEYRFGKKPKLYRAPAEGEYVDAGQNGYYEGGEGMLPKPTNLGGGGGGPTAGRRAGGGGGGVSVTPPASATSAAGPSYGSVAPPASAPVATGRGVTGGHNPKPNTKDNKDEGKNGKNNNRNGNDPSAGFGIEGSNIKVNANAPGGGLDAHYNKNAHGNQQDQNDDDEDDLGLFQGGRALKPMPKFFTQELAELAGTIQRDILDTNPNVKFDHIAELQVAKDLLKEAVVMPIKYPELFAGLVRPWKGILLFGPPGTGKTMLAKAVATECKTTFFNISASSIVSKWRGDSEKLVRMLFDLAVHYAPSTIFIDELDSIMSARSSDGSEHEGSRRMKTELLIQIDGLSKRKGGDVVFVLAASNVPWDLDAAILRRLEKRILVTLPSEAARVDMFRQNLTANANAGKRGNAQTQQQLCPLQDDALQVAAKATDGYSGADVDIICREATMRTIRKLIAQLESTKNPSNLSNQPHNVQRPTVTAVDLMAAIHCTNPSTNHSELGKYDEWAEKFGSTMS